MNKQYRYFAADFETTVYEGQAYTEVWSAAIAEINGPDDVQVFHSIDDFFNYLFTLSGNLIVYYHNLKFDGSFLLNYIIHDLKFTLSADQIGDEFYQIKFHRENEMKSHEYRYIILDRGQWYNIEVQKGRLHIEFRDSLKLMPFTLADVGKAFDTRHRKLEMDYTGFRYAGCEITDEEMAYIKNDVLVLKEALEFMFSEHHNAMTIGSCCYSEFKRILGTMAFRRMFPDLTQLAYNEQESIDSFIRRSYRGGWCYLKPDMANRILYNGSTYDVNSEYPSQMHSDGKRRYPYGQPKIFSGPPPAAIDNDDTIYYFVRFTCRFNLKPGHLPFVQIKGNLLYRGTENLTTSDVKMGSCYYSYFMDYDGSIRPARVTLTMSKTDWILFNEHYDVTDLAFDGGVYFATAIGIFDSYINRYAKIKMESKGARRTLAKLFLNNLYGKFASNTDSSFKVALYTDDGLEFGIQQANDKKAGYIAVGAAITSYSRDFIIRSAQSNYDKFVYADTDSIHMIGTTDNLPVDDVKFNHWKKEGSWDYGIFVRQKTYIEHVIAENDKPVTPYHNIKCAGLPDRCKELLRHSLEGCENLDPEELQAMPDDFKNFVKQKREYTDFKIGLVIPGKLVPKQIRGGVILVETPYQISG